MEKYINAFKKQLQNMKIGRAHPSLLEGIMVKTPEGNFSLKSLGTVVVKNPRLLVVTVYDKDVKFYQIYNLPIIGSWCSRGSN